MTSTSRISDFPPGDQDRGGEVVISQVHGGRFRTRTYDLGTAAGRSIGTSFGNVPELNTRGVIGTGLGGTGISAAIVGANKVFGTDAQGNPAIRDLPGGTLSLLDGSVTTVKLADGAVTGAKVAADSIITGNIKDDAITGAKIQDGAVDAAQLADGAVETAKLAAHSVTAGKLGQGAVNNAALGAKAVRLSNLDYTGSATDGQVLEKTTIGGVELLRWTDKGELSIADGSITSAKIADGAIIADKLPAGVIGTDKLAEDAVTLAKLDTKNAGEVGQSLTKTADGRLEFRSAIEISAVPDGSITASKLASNSVTIAKIAGETITNAAISASAAIALSKLNIQGTAQLGYTIQNIGENAYAWRPNSGLASIPDGSLGAAKIATSAITTNKLRDGAVTNIKVAADADIAITKLDIGGTQVSGKFLSATSATGASWVDRPETEPVDGSVTTVKLASGAVTGAKMANNSVSGNILANNGIARAKLADQIINTAKLADDAVTAAKLAGNSVGFGNLIYSGSVVDEYVLTADVVGATTTLKWTSKGAASVADGSITTPKLADDAVTEAKIANQSITPSMLKTG